MADKSALEQDDLAAIMRHDPSRRFLARLVEHSGLLRSAYADGDRLHAFNEGKRSVGKWLKDELDAIDAEHFILLLREAEHGRRSDRNNRTRDD